MSFGISNNIKSRAVRPCTPDLLNRALDSELVNLVCAEIRDALEACRLGYLTKEEYETKKGELKKRLPILTPHATFVNGRRVNADAQSSGLSMYDKDHMEHPKAYYEEKIAGRETELGIVMAHITPSTEGVRLIFVMPKGMNLEQAQRWMSLKLDDREYDGCVKDLARSSFIVPRDYVLYLNEEKLFGDVQPQVVDEFVVSPEEQQLPEQNGAANGYPDVYDGVPYELIVHALEEQLGGIPAHGSRNNFIFAMACHLRYICNDDAAWIASILPTYGEAKERAWGTIHSACNRAQSRDFPYILKRALLQAGSHHRVNMQSNHPATAPALPKKLPSLIKLLTSKVPDEMKPAVAHAVFPALGAHLNNVRFRYIDNVEHEATFMCVLLAKMSSGKSAVNKPIEYILADIKQRDDLNRAREQEWKNMTNTKGSNKEKPKRPTDLCIQILSADMTNAAFIQRLNDAGGKFLFTQMDEIELLDQLKTSAKGNQVTQIIRLAFDCGLYGQERVGTQSVTAQVRLKWNWNASSTIQKGRWYFRNALTDGTLSRLNFCTIEPQQSGEIPVYGTYDEAFAEELKPYIDRLNCATGLVECAKAESLAHRLLKENAEMACLSDDEAYEMLSYRANVIAYLKAMTLYVAEGKWSKETEEFVRWSEAYDLWCKMQFFGEQLQQELNVENMVIRHGPRNMLEQLPDIFSREELVNVRKAMGKSTECKQLLYVWRMRGYIVQDEATGKYVKLQRKHL